MLTGIQEIQNVTQELSGIDYGYCTNQWWANFGRRRHFYFQFYDHVLFFDFLSICATLALSHFRNMSIFGGNIFSIWATGPKKVQKCFFSTLVFWHSGNLKEKRTSVTLELWYSGRCIWENDWLSLYYFGTLEYVWGKWVTVTLVLLYSQQNCDSDKTFLSVLSTLKGFNPKRTHTLVLSTLGVLMSRKKINTNSRTLTLHFGCWDSTLSAIRHHKNLNIKTR